MNMIDLWLKMNRCVRDAQDNITYTDEDGVQCLGRITKYEVKDTELVIGITVVKPVDFIICNVNITKDGVEFE